MNRGRWTVGIILTAFLAAIAGVFAGRALIPAGAGYSRSTTTISRGAGSLVAVSSAFRAWSRDW